MKRNLSIWLAVCLSAVLLVGCSAKEDTSVSESSAGSGVISSGDPENETKPAEVSDPHTPKVSSTFELNGIRFWHHDDVEMECLVLEELQLAEITLDGTMLHVDVKDKADESTWYDNIVSRGKKTASTSGDVCYRSDTDLMWEIATESGKIIALYGDSGDDWKEIGKMLEWTVIDGDNSGTDSSFNMGGVAIEHPDDGFTIKDCLFEPADGITLTPAGQPLTLGDITISDILLSDTYEYVGHSENPGLEEKAYYDFNMIATSVSEDEWGMVPFLSYLVPYILSQRRKYVFLFCGL